MYIYLLYVISHIILNIKGKHMAFILCYINFNIFKKMQRIHVLDEISRTYLKYISILGNYISIQLLIADSIHLYIYS